jgi:hypothetical protein
MAHRLDGAPNNRRPDTVFCLNRASAVTKNQAEGFKNKIPLDTGPACA